jgi:hypothetical protein
MRGPASRTTASRAERIKPAAGWPSRRLRAPAWRPRATRARAQPPCPGCRTPTCPGARGGRAQHPAVRGPASPGTPRPFLQALWDANKRRACSLAHTHATGSHRHWPLSIERLCRCPDPTHTEPPHGALRALPLFTHLRHLAKGLSKPDHAVCCAPRLQSALLKLYNSVPSHLCRSSAIVPDEPTILTAACVRPCSVPAFSDAHNPQQRRGGLVPLNRENNPIGRVTLCTIGNKNGGSVRAHRVWPAGARHILSLGSGQRGIE